MYTYGRNSHVQQLRSEPHKSSEKLLELIGYVLYYNGDTHLEKTKYANISSFSLKQHTNVVKSIVI